MVTPIDAIRLHSTFGEAAFWPRTAAPVPDYETEHLAAARGAILGLALSGLMWIGLIAGFRMILGL